MFDEIKTPKGLLFSELSPSELEDIADHPKASKEQKDAAIHWMKVKKDTEDNKQENATEKTPAPKPPAPKPPAQAVEPVTSKALSQWGSRSELREFNNRLAGMALPGGKRLTEEERYALAQASIAHGLDPFNGEIWIIPGGGLMIGIKGLRKKAHQQVRGNFWVDFREISDADEKVRLGIPSNALAFEARLFDSENIRTYTDTVGALLKSGVPWEAVSKMVGEKPYTSGIGYSLPTESSKMTLPARAMKRAEAEAIKRRFDVPFGFGVSESEPEIQTPSYAVDNAVLWGEE